MTHYYKATWHHPVYGTITAYVEDESSNIYGAAAQAAEKIFNDRKNDPPFPTNDIYTEMEMELEFSE